MTTSTRQAVTPDAEGRHGRPRTGGDVATEFAWLMAQEGFQRGDLAGLRRMKPDAAGRGGLLEAHGPTGAPGAGG